MLKLIVPVLAASFVLACGRAENNSSELSEETSAIELKTASQMGYQPTVHVISYPEPASVDDINFYLHGFGFAEIKERCVTSPAADGSASILVLKYTRSADRRMIDIFKTDVVVKPETKVVKPVRGYAAFGGYAVSMTDMLTMYKFDLSIQGVPLTFSLSFNPNQGHPRPLNIYTSDNRVIGYTCSLQKS